MVDDGHLADWNDSLPKQRVEGWSGRLGFQDPWDTVGLHRLPRRRSNGAATGPWAGDLAVRGSAAPIQRGERDSPPPKVGRRLPP